MAAGNASGPGIPDARCASASTEDATQRWADDPQPLDTVGACDLDSAASSELAPRSEDDLDPTSSGPPSTPGRGAARTSTTRPLARTILAQCGLRGSRSIRIGSEAAPAPAPLPSSGRLCASLHTVGPETSVLRSNVCGSLRTGRVGKNQVDIGQPPLTGPRSIGRELRKATRRHLVADICDRAACEYRSIDAAEILRHRR
jgi:hypothetical protein